MLKDLSIPLQNLVCRAYLADPQRTKIDLEQLASTSSKYALVATELQIDHETGRLQENHAILEPRNVRSPALHG